MMNMTANNMTSYGPRRNAMIRRAVVFMATAAISLLCVMDAFAVNVRDICSLQGARENQLMAVSLVVGLNGTGDGQSLETVRSLGRFFERFGHSGVTMDGLNPSNVALVHVTATIPSTGIRKGGKLNVQVSSINGAKSLAGGRLVQCQLLGPMATAAPGGAFGLAGGQLIVNKNNETTASVRGGAVMEHDFVPSVIKNGRIRLILDKDHAGWAIASSIARVINDAEASPGEFIAKAVAAAEVAVLIPVSDSTNPAEFIARVLDLPVLMPDLKARIVINRSTGTIVITGDVEIDPVSFSKSGLTINTLNPARIPTLDNPQVKTERFQTFDPAGGSGGASARKLTEAFNQLQVPVADQIDVIWALKRTGRLHAEIIEE